MALLLLRMGTTADVIQDEADDGSPHDHSDVHNLSRRGRETRGHGIHLRQKSFVFHVNSIFRFRRGIEKKVLTKRPGALTNRRAGIQKGLLASARNFSL